MTMHETYCNEINNTMKCVLFCIQNQGWKIAFGSIGVQKTITFDGFAKKKTRLANLPNRCDFKSRYFKSRDADFESLAMQNS